MVEHVDAWGRLLAAANAGEARAYTRFLQAVTPVLRGIIRAKAGGLGDATCEDVLQEVLLAVHLKRHTWDASAPVRPWLYTIARYKVIDAFRERGRKIDVPIEDFAEIFATEAGPDPTEAADMDKMIGMLDGRSAVIVRMIGLEGVSMAETGAALHFAASCSDCPGLSGLPRRSGGIRPVGGGLCAALHRGQPAVLCHLVWSGDHGRDAAVYPDRREIVAVVAARAPRTSPPRSAPRPRGCCGLPHARPGAGFCRAGNPSIVGFHRSPASRSGRPRPKDRHC